MLRRTFLMGTAAAAALMTAGVVVPSKAADRVGVVVNVTVPGKSGPVRIYAYSSFYNNVPSGSASAQAVGSPLYFYGAPKLLTFTAQNQAHYEAEGLFNRQRATFIMDVSDDPGSVSFKIIQNDKIILSTPTDALSRANLLNGSIQLYAP